MKLSICAYFLSEFDERAVKFLRYRTRNEAMASISNLLGNGNNYLKRRRDEFDVLTGSHRKGQWNRAPTPSVLKIHQELKEFSFSELAVIVQHLLSDPNTFAASTIPDACIKGNSESLDDNEIEYFINQRDTSAGRIKRSREVLDRICSAQIPNKLKDLYVYRCQICGLGSEDTFGYEIVEAHHIVPFSLSLNNDSSNIIILCPNHHRLMHTGNPSFDRQAKTFIYSNGYREILKYNFHL